MTGSQNVPKVYTTTFDGVVYRRIGNTVYVTSGGTFPTTTKAIASGGTLTTIPAGYRPSTVYIGFAFSSNRPANSSNADSDHIIRIQYTASGPISYAGTGSNRTIASGSVIRFSASYITNDAYPS